jgi:hypothetical protein
LITAPAPPTPILDRVWPLPPPPPATEAETKQPPGGARNDVPPAIFNDWKPNERIIVLATSKDGVAVGVIDIDEVIEGVIEGVGDCDAVGDGVGKMHEVIKTAPSNPLR